MLWVVLVPLLVISIFASTKALRPDTYLAFLATSPIRPRALFMKVTERLRRCGLDCSDRTVCGLDQTKKPQKKAAKHSQSSLPSLRTPGSQPSACQGLAHWTAGRPLREKKQRKVFLYTVSPKRPRAAHIFNHGCWRLAVGGWRLAVGGDWRLAVGNWRLVAVGGGWWRLVVGDWWLVAVVGGWPLALGCRWRLKAVGGWRLVAGGGWRWLVVGGWWSLGEVLKGGLKKKI